MFSTSRFHVLVYSALICFQTLVPAAASAGVISAPSLANSSNLKVETIRAFEKSAVAGTNRSDKAILIADRWSSLHPEQDSNSPSYSGRGAPGPVHGGDPHGGDLHDESHDDGLPANQARDNYPDNKDPYGGTVPR